jgi:flagellar export protein FliJ
MMEPKPGEAFDVEERMMLERYVKTVQQDQERQKVQIQNAEQAVREQEAVLKQAGIDVKVLEKLKEKQLEEFKAEMLREEAYFLDDLASQQYIRAQETSARLASEAELLTHPEEAIGS